MMCVCISADLFEKMVPMEVQQALAASNHRKAALVNQVVGTMRESTGLLNGSATGRTRSYRVLTACGAVPLIH